LNIEVEHPKEDKSRLGGFSYIYGDICEREFSKVLEIEEQLATQMDEQLQAELEGKHFESGVKAILFAALSVEAAINDYAAWQLGDKYFDDHLSSLNVISKWVVIPKLVCGRSIDKSGPGFSSLRKLISARNDLAHNKSRNFDLRDPDIYSKLEKRSKVFENNVLNAYQCIVLLSLTMDQLVGPRFNPLKSFNKKVSLFLEIPKNAVPIVNNCRNIIAKNLS